MGHFCTNFVVGMFKNEDIFTNGCSFRDEFLQFLDEHGFSFVELQSGFSGPAVGTSFYFESHKLLVVLVYLQHFRQQAQLPFHIDTVYVYEDRWFSNKELMKKRILSRLGVFKSVFARKCKVIYDSQVKADSRINKHISDFLNQYHSYGDAKCRYRYALEYEGQTVAVATFSAPRPMPRQMIVQYREASQLTGEGPSVVFDSYEWVRYASLPDVRVVGGMGRLFKAFLEDAMCRNAMCGDVKRPFEVMTYSDTEWSSGDVYEKLGFRLVQERKPVEFYVDRNTFERVAINKVSPHFECGDTYVKICNKGSRKYLYNSSPIDWLSLV